jgi:hypothetical protein
MYDLGRRGSALMSALHKANLDRQDELSPPPNTFGLNW